ncbi:hypothetical protein GWI33_015144 [Rhynchophorus ferrugineus]|uniref:Uncharacterized protein n=1 Tax=Rhynchophorus ferrugineus TaxID=354439 RepID=A0A834I494_RHYFE|nr:hypothetical protein GWI33_015144 [Rhynchophorus ferrugineus]
MPDDLIRTMGREVRGKSGPFLSLITSRATRIRMFPEGVLAPTWELDGATKELRIGPLFVNKERRFAKYNYNIRLAERIRFSRLFFAE